MVPAIVHFLADDLELWSGHQTSIFVLRYIRKRHGLIIHIEINHIAVKNETA